jgi:predicted Rossmann fold flavoprotein
MIYDVIVIGAGPAGLMAANLLEENKINYLLLEKNEKPGKKLLLTGGKRCNVTNNQTVDGFISSLNLKHKKFLLQALNQFGPNEVIRFFKNNHLNLELEDNFKYFPETKKSMSVLEALLKNINSNRLIINQAVKDIKKTDDLFILNTASNTYQSKNVIVAVGSNAYPTTGSSGDGIQFAKKFDINYIPYTPAETHIFSNYVKNELIDLQGLSLTNIKVKINQTKISFQGDLIFTHFGLSGPVIMHLSEDIYKELQNKEVYITLNLVDKNYEELMNLFQKNQKDTIINQLDQYMPKRLSKKILELLGITNKPINQTSKKDLNSIIENMINFSIKIDQVQVKELAYVNAGGIDTKELNSNSFEVKKVQGLYFIGEAVDVHGPIGGYNITIGLSMANLCVRDIILKIRT